MLAQQSSQPERKDPQWGQGTLTNPDFRVPLRSWLAMADSPFSNVGDLARDCIYLVAGVGVLAFQKAQVARREIGQKIDLSRSDEPSSGS
jgi:hypothetical protein